MADAERPDDVDRIGHEATGDAATHVIRVDEQIVEFDGPVDEACRRETDDRAVLGCEPGASVVHEGVVEHERLGVGEEERPVAVVRQRRTPVDAGQRRHVVGDRGAHGEAMQVHGSVHPTTVPAACVETWPDSVDWLHGEGRRSALIPAITHPARIGRSMRCQMPVSFVES